MVDPALYPPGWRLETSGRNRDLGGGDIENMRLGFSTQTPPGYVSLHTVSRYASREAAQHGFDTLRQHSQLSESELPIQNKIVFTGKAAERSSIYCEKGPGRVPICVALAQYGAYVSEFSSYIDGRLMSIADFERILEAIDQRMAAVVKK
jgi:hypothetical protein